MDAPRGCPLFHTHFLTTPPPKGKERKGKAGNWPAPQREVEGKMEADRGGKGKGKGAEGESESVTCLLF